MRKAIRKGESPARMVVVGAIGLLLMYAFITSGISSGLQDAKETTGFDQVLTFLDDAAGFNEDGVAMENVTIGSTIELDSNSAQGYYVTNYWANWNGSYSGPGNDSGALKVYASVPAPDSSSVKISIREDTGGDNDPSNDTIIRTVEMDDGENTIILDDPTRYSLQVVYDRDSVNVTSPSVDRIEAGSTTTTTSEYAGLYDVLFVVFALTMVASIARYGGIL